MNASAIDPGRVLGYKFEESSFDYSIRDVILYALGIGAAALDQTNPAELAFVYEGESGRNLQVLPTFGVLFPSSLVSELLKVPGLQFDPKLLLHGEQYLEVLRPLSSEGQIKNTSSVTGLHDKGKAAMIEVETRSCDAQTGQLVCINRSTCVLRGAGGFSSHTTSPSTSGRDSSTSAKPARSSAASKSGRKPDLSRTPDFVHEERTAPDQALVYRLSGDHNPLHADPAFAKAAGFPRPILHGLCSLGFAVRAVLKKCCGDDVSLFKSVQARFLLHVFPGETLVTEIWQTPGSTSLTFRTSVKERQKPVLSGTIRLNLAHSRI
ncbi:enoyl-CoA hydratase 2 [Klebsormidium nitens]|uniref:Enoyl-CoA hydratase 2 n=1 Tax=Klebsormidium nitens TaxID=105231 RepID=A0A1Y1IIF0_KLENI|nr:enoyl-CoA hydratase 2 [Klebsormidium nitens]|eukprot:GAQ87928.1 enoyl-CoA hydratase 2 [Klebsormidium nitens]